MLNHPALMNQRSPRESVTVEEWDHHIAWLTARIETERDQSSLEILGWQRLAALAHRDQAYAARERGLRELLATK